MTFPNDPIQMDEEDEAPAQSGSRLASWLMIFGLGFFFLPLFLIANTIRDNTADLQSELDNVQATLAYTPPPDPSAEALTSTLIAVRQKNEALASLQGTLVGMHIDWPSIMAVIAAYDQARMGITMITQGAATITIGGQADDQSVVSAYADMLRASSLFEQVAVGSILMEVLPTPTPTRTPTRAPNDTPTLTPEPTILFEPRSVANFLITVVVKPKVS